MSKLARLHPRRASYLGGDVGGREGDDHAGFDDAGFDSTHGHRSNSADLVDVLERKPESLVGERKIKVDGKRKIGRIR